LTINDYTQKTLGIKLGKIKKAEAIFQKQVDKLAGELTGKRQLAEIYKQTPQSGTVNNPMESVIEDENSITLNSAILEVLAIQIQMMETKGVKPIFEEDLASEKSVALSSSLKSSKSSVAERANESIQEGSLCFAF
jgi:vancomycin resistance protein YoaR